MRKAKYQVTRSMTKGRVKTTNHRTKEAAFKTASKSLKGYGVAEIQKVKPAKAKAKKRISRSKK